jgi:HemY protein
MRRFVIGIILLIFSVWVGLKIARDPGLALFTYSHWSVEMPLWFALVCLMLLLVVVYFLTHFFDEIDRSFYRWKNWLRWRRKNKSYSKTNRGLVELIEGHWRNAENYLLDGIDQSDAPLINYLAAAKAAHEREAYDKRDTYIRQAYDLSPQAQLQLDQGQLEQALATLNHLRSIAPLNKVVLKLSQKLFIQLADWKGLLKLLPSLCKAKLISLEQYEHLEVRVYREMLNSTANKAQDLKVFHEFWAIVPRRVQKNPQFVACYVKHILRYAEAANEVEELINRVLKKTWDSDLVKMYGLLVTDNSKKQLSHAEKWLKLYPNQAVLLLTLGRLCMRCQLWGKARQYLEDSLQLEAIPDTYIEYGKLFEQLGDMSAAVECYRDGLVLAVD